MKTAISLPDDVFEAAEVMIESRGWTRSRLYTEALREYLRHQDSEAITAALDQVHPGDSGVSDAVRRGANRAVLGATEW